MTPTRRDIVIGVVLYPETLPLDFIGPTCLLNALSPARLSPPSANSAPSSTSGVQTKASFKCVHLAESAATVSCSFGLNVVANATFSDVREGKLAIDAILLPGGTGARPWNASDELKNFVQWAAESEQIEYVLTVCTGSWLLASTGALDGQRATTNKKAYAECKEHTASQAVDWVPKARWVRSGKFWTAAGVSAGMDMASAFIDEVAGVEAGDAARGFAEYTANSEGDDPWAEKSGQV